MRKPVLVFCYLLITIPGRSAVIQPAHCFIVPVPRIYRASPVSIDPVELRMIRGEWRPPKEGDTEWFLDGDSAVWSQLEADSAGWFSDRILRDAYAAFTLTLDREQTLILEAGGHQYAYINGRPRGTNKYGVKEQYESWEPRFDYFQIPVRMREGDNHLLFRCSRGRFRARFLVPSQPVFLNTRDLTLPDLLNGSPHSGAVPVTNAGDSDLSDLILKTRVSEGTWTRTKLPVLAPRSVRKMPFGVQQSGLEPGYYRLDLHLLKGEELIDTASVSIGVKNLPDIHRRTYVSSIDGSVQYYAVTPARQTVKPAALVLSVHGAGVEAINQARSYHPKERTHVVAATNRRPFGYDWEDWGRIDAMEALEHAINHLNADRERIYLTGHSMGGHGTWHLGVTYPDRFAAIGPSAGWISFSTYAPRQQKGSESPLSRLMMRTMNPGNTLALTSNLNGVGVYILHGDADESVPVSEARTMAGHLAGFHHDFQYHEEPGAGHWWDRSDEPGVDCVDWAPMFDFFARRSLPPGRPRSVSFSTSNPGISASRHWLRIEAQQRHSEISRADMTWYPGTERFAGVTENIFRLSLETPETTPETGSYTVILDGDTLTGLSPAQERLWLEREVNGWKASKIFSSREKGPHRYGPFKEAFNHHMIFVYGTRGGAEENAWAFSKARYDAECFWIQGNGSVDVVADRDFHPSAAKDRSVILYGNAETNGTWNSLLRNCPVQVFRNRIQIGKTRLKGDDLACLMAYPRPDSETAMVAVVAGTGILGMKLTNTRPYLYSGWGIPDCLVFDASAAEDPEKGLRAVGYFGTDWSVEKGEFGFRQ